MVTTSAKLFDRRGDRWDTLRDKGHDPVAAALREIADRRLKHQRGYDSGPVRKPRYDGAQMHPNPQSLLNVKPLKLIEKHAFAAEVERRREPPPKKSGMDLVTRLVPVAEVDLVLLSQDELQARVDEGRTWVAEERARIAALRR